MSERLPVGQPADVRPPKADPGMARNYLISREKLPLAGRGTQLEMRFDEVAAVGDDRNLNSNAAVWGERFVRLRLRPFLSVPE